MNGLPDDLTPESKLRRLTRYWLMTAGLYGWGLLLLWFLADQNDGERRLLLLLAISVGVGQALSLFLVRFFYERGLRLSLLAELQIAQIIVATAAAYLIVPQVRGALLAVPLVAMLFCAFAVSGRQALWIALAAIAVLGATMLGAAVNRPDIFLPMQEAFHFGLITSLLLVTAYMSGEFHKLRARLWLQKEEMQNALGRISVLATVDDLTQLPNRRRMKEIIAEEPFKRSSDGPRPCLILLDIDYFKSINDTHGHSVGDEVLRIFAARASEALRITDVIARWGGEEFLLLLPDTDHDAALRVLHRLRDDVRVLPVPSLPHALTITFSAGITWLTANGTVNEAIAQADRAMYRAKLEGRNTWRFFQPHIDVNPAPAKFDAVTAAHFMRSSISDLAALVDPADDDELLFEESESCNEDIEAADVDLSELTVLVVEDDQLQRDVLLMLLEELKALEPLVAQDGVSALAMLANSPRTIHVILTDLNMPGMDGIEFMHRLGESGAPASVVLVSAVDSAVMKGVEQVADAYGIALLGVLPKPVLKSQLARLLGRINLLKRPAPKLAPETQAYLPRELELALLNREFEPFFQAKVNTQTGRIEGYEALARWRKPGSGVIAPAAFIAVMEESDLIDALAFAILEKSAAACNQWRKLGFDFCVSVNVSVRTLSRPDCAQRLLRIVKDEGLPASCMTIEVTESSAYARELNTVLANLARLRVNGFGLSIDDYGTGYSSMERLSRIAFTELKIDRSFVTSAQRNASAMAIMQSSVSVAKALNMASVAEGVETQEHWQLVRDSGCGLAQGYYICRPVEAAAVLPAAHQWHERVQRGDVQTLDLLLA